MNRHSGRGAMSIHRSNMHPVAFGELFLYRPYSTRFCR